MAEFVDHTAWLTDRLRNDREFAKEFLIAAIREAQCDLELQDALAVFSAAIKGPSDFRGSAQG